MTTILNISLSLSGTITPPLPLRDRAPQLLHKLWDLDLGNVEATPYVKLRAASPLQPPTLEDVHLQAPVPGTSPPSEYNSYYAILLGSGPPQGSHLSVPSITRSFLSSVAVPVAPFKLQPAPSTLQHKLHIPKPTLRPILTQVLHNPRLMVT
ncbi:hypothetical protein F5051DRAFT_447438 [Lentinula edodes]|nr:hypothetical protein F5051DRAFT_447438 [Lentinula edodes]